MWFFVFLHNLVRGFIYLLTCAAPFDGWVVGGMIL